jgi:hypothetical protein
MLRSTDVASSRSQPTTGWDKTSGKPPAGVDIYCGQQPKDAVENTSAEAPRGEGGSSE